MNQIQPTEDSILLRGREIRVVSCSLAQADLRFYPENPRIYSSVWTNDGVEPSQEEIFRALSRSEHVRETLVPSITNNGGLIEPILVRNNVVLEGNSRLAAYRLLVQTDSKKWCYIRAKVLPTDITDSEVFSLLGEYHMVGKKDWQPFEQAGYLYRRFKTHAVPEDALQKEVGLSLSKIRHLIRVYDFMVRHEDRSPERWSYYDELLRGKRFDSARQLFPQFDEYIALKIASSEIERAVDLRDKLPQIVKAGGNTLRKFMNGAYTFTEAAEDSRLRGAGNYHGRKLADFRKWLVDESLEKELTGINEADRNFIKYELEKIQSRSKQLLLKITK